MCPTSRERARGFALVSAIFLVVILALLAAALVSLSGTQAGGQALDVGGSRAWQAARAGIEWGIAQLSDPRNADAGLSASPPQPPACFASPHAITLGSELDGMQVSITCARVTTTEADRQLAVYTLTATASGGGGGFPLARQMQATVARCTDPGGTAPRYACP